MLDAQFQGLFADTIGRSIIWIYAFLVGICLGSFASAIADRTAKGVSWVSKSDGGAARSSCPSCHHQLSWLDLVPLFSWLYLGGKCRYCKKQISARYPFIEFVGGTSLLMVVSLFGLSLPTLIILICLPFALSGLLLSMQKQVCPNYMLLLLCASYITSLFVVESLVFAPLFLLAAVIFIYMTRRFSWLGVPQVIFFAFWMNITLTFCQKFTFHL